ncbi:TIGR02679 domain-containing protein [Streptomyces sp. ISL-100]|uniref:TIGR02679 domain-containing protein n=1 Tax=Streptomyces sp. ISL-100 TaxID=2819173 RepID=UPI0020353036|nr:TIGR02679 domain-containing protein [Streptomyces sp. ISL-100]
MPLKAGAEARRELWDAFGVIVDDLASRILVLNLPATGQGLGRWLTDAARYGTLRAGWP